MNFEEEIKQCLNKSIDKKSSYYEQQLEEKTEQIAELYLQWFEKERPEQQPDDTFNNHNPKEIQQKIKEIGNKIKEIMQQEYKSSWLPQRLFGGSLLARNVIKLKDLFWTLFQLDIEEIPDMSVDQTKDSDADQTKGFEVYSAKDCEVYFTKDYEVQSTKDSEVQSTKDPQQEYYDDYGNRMSGMPENGTIQTYWTLEDGQTGNKKVVCDYKNGIKHGEEIWYYLNGNLHTQSQYKNGILDGIIKQWDEQKNLIFEGEYVLGKLTKKKYC